DERVNALVGGEVLPDARRRRAVRDPLRPPRHRPIGHLRAGTARIPGADLVGDAARVLDAYSIPAAHVVGVSMGGALAQLFALDSPIASCRWSSSARLSRCRVSGTCRRAP